MLHVELALRLTVRRLGYIPRFGCVQWRFRVRRCSARQNVGRFTRHGVVARTFGGTLAALAATTATAPTTPAALAPLLGRHRTRCSFGQHAGAFGCDIELACLVVETRLRRMVRVDRPLLLMTRLLAAACAFVATPFAAFASARLACFARLARFAAAGFASFASFIAAGCSRFFATLGVAPLVAPRFPRLLMPLARLFAAPRIP
jgi:hypothetical protein